MNSNNNNNYSILVLPLTSSTFIPFSTKYPELVIPDESVCLPRWEIEELEEFIKAVFQNKVCWQKNQILKYLHTTK